MYFVLNGLLDFLKLREIMLKLHIQKYNKNTTESTTQFCSLVLKVIVDSSGLILIKFYPKYIKFGATL